MIDLSMMNNVLEVHEADMDAHVQAGVTREQLNEYIRYSGLFFPVDPGANASIGGMCATNASGTTTLRYGNMQANVLGLTAVSASGDIMRTGGRSRKSSAGYDLTKLLVGSEGTLAVITEIMVRLHPQPQHTAAAVCSLGSLSDAINACVDAMYVCQPARMELLDAATMSALDGFKGQSFAVKPTIFFEFHGSETQVAHDTEALRSIVEGYSCDHFESSDVQEERTRLWQARHDAFWAVKAKWPGKDILATDVCVPVSRLPEIIEETNDDIISTGLEAAPLFGHVGDGNFHLLICYESEDPDDVQRVRDIEHRLVMRAIRMGGTCTGEHGIGNSKMQYLQHEFGEGSISAMRSVKAALDPLSILNPGKIIQTET